MKNPKIESRLNERKSGFLSDLTAVLKKPKEKLFTNGELDTEKFSTFLNNYVQAYLQETVKECNFLKEQIPIVAVQDLITTPPGDPTGSRSFGNYSTSFNFIEVNKNLFKPDMSDAELSQRITTALVGVAHEFRHFVQSAYANDGVPESKVVSDRLISEEMNESYHETKLPLEQSQKASLEETLGGKDKAQAIKDDLLYGSGKMGLISIAEQNQDKTSAYADGNNAARNLKFLNNGDKRAPIIQAYYYNLEHEIDARSAAPSVVFEVAKDCGVFSKDFAKLAKESVSQFFIGKIDSVKQPKKAVEVLINTACGNKKGDLGITPEMIEKYCNTKAEDMKLFESEKTEYVQGAIATLLHRLPNNKSQEYLAELKQTTIDSSLINKAEKIYEERQSSVTPITKEEVIAVSPDYYESKSEVEKNTKPANEITKDENGKVIDETVSRNLE